MNVVLYARVSSEKQGKGWGKTGLYSILTNDIYAGVFVWVRNYTCKGHLNMTE